MLTKEVIEDLKKAWFSFEQINELKNRLDSIDNWTANFLNEEEFWWKVYAKINHNMKAKCIK